MTIPQIVTWVGCTLGIISGLFTIIHTINMIVPRIDFIIATSQLGGGAYAVSVPLLIIGIVIGVVGIILQRREEQQYTNRDDY